MQSITCQILTLRGPTMKQLTSLYLSYFLYHRESPYLVTILIFRECKGSLRFFYPEIIIFGGLCVLTHWQSHLSPLSLSLPPPLLYSSPSFFPFENIQQSILLSVRRLSIQSEETQQDCLIQKVEEDVGLRYSEKLMMLQDE